MMQPMMQRNSKGDILKAYIVMDNLTRSTSSFDDAYHRMFFNQGWSVTRVLAHADLVQFTGGSDVTPSLYGQIPHMTTSFDKYRDAREIVVFNLALKYGIPMVGICRGGQFLNVMCGGDMFQDVDNHAITGTHDVIDCINGDVFQATSTHHQMMDPSKDAMVLGIATNSRRREKMHKTLKLQRQFYNVGSKAEDWDDYEVVLYAEQKCLCFQPHPEFAGFPELKDRYFQYINDYLFEKPKLIT